MLVLVLDLVLVVWAASHRFFFFPPSQSCWFCVLGVRVRPVIKLWFWGLTLDPQTTDVTFLWCLLLLRLSLIINAVEATRRKLKRQS